MHTCTQNQINGGGTSVGSNAIQLAVAAGYEVITTASSKNFDYVKKLGASQAFDYNSPTVIKDIVKAFHKKDIAGATAYAPGTFEPCFAIVRKIDGLKLVSSAVWLPDILRDDIGTKFIQVTDIPRNTGLIHTIMGEFLQKVLATGKYIAAADPHIVGNGFENIKAALDFLKKGLSAKNAVVLL